MGTRSIIKTAAIAAAAGLFATVATLSLTTTAPGPVHAEIPATMLAAPAPGQVPSLAPMLKSVLPAVVNIAVSGKAEVQQQNPLLNDPFFRRFFNQPDEQQPQQPQQEETHAIGSGVIVDAEKGYVVTNNHVVADADTIKVRLNDDREFTAKLIGTDPDSDLAILQIKAKSLTALPVADSDKAEVGDFVVAIGSPFNLRQTVTSGIVSALGRQGLGDGYEDFIQTDASINPGNSGGALVNLRGELIGINSQILSRSGGNMGIGFAIPTNLVKSVMAQLIESGSVSRGRIGIQGGQELTPELAKAFNVPDGHGALIGKVSPDSPADKAGLKDGDVIIEANGKPVKDFPQLRYIIGLARVGEKVNVKYLRDGKQKETTVVVAKNNDDKRASAEGLFPGLKGASFGPLAGAGAEAARAAGVKGVQIVAVEPRSPAAKAGLKANDVIISVNRQPVATVSEFTALASQQKEGQMLLHVLRGSQAAFVVIEAAP